MFLLHSWTEPDAASPYHVACDTCQDFAAFLTERERWQWTQAHLCPVPPPSLLYLADKHKAVEPVDASS